MLKNNLIQNQFFLENKSLYSSKPSTFINNQLCATYILYAIVLRLKLQAYPKFFYIHSLCLYTHPLYLYIHPRLLIDSSRFFFSYYTMDLHCTFSLLCLGVDFTIFLSRSRVAFIASLLFLK